MAAAISSLNALTLVRTWARSAPFSTLEHGGVGSRSGGDRRAKDQELENGAALHVARNELAGDVLRGERLEHAPGVLARHSEVARGPVRVGAEAEAVARAPHLAPVEHAVAVGVHD